MLRIEHISKKYHHFSVVDDISFSISAGEVVGLLGKNGAGKSTTLQIIAGVLGFSQGDCIHNDISLRGNALEYKKNIGYLPEIPPLYSGMTVEQYLLFVAELHLVADPTQATIAVLERCNLLEKRKIYIEQLSKGWKQRVGLAQALIHRPSVLLLDEPTAGLDPQQQHEFAQIIQEEQRRGTAILLSTHIVSEIEAICHRILLLDQEKIRLDQSMDKRVYSVHCTVETMPSDMPEFCSAISKDIPAITQIHHKGNSLKIECTADCRADIARALVPYGLLELQSQTGLKEIIAPWMLSNTSMGASVHDRREHNHV
jgi:ABC-2 type transport system ATP-binding protein